MSFIISRLIFFSINYNDKDTIEYMINFGNCDIKYIICTYLRGFCVK